MVSPGDLYVVFQVRDHELFERDGDDIYCEIPITFAQAALGDEIEVSYPIWKGKIKSTSRNIDWDTFSITR